MTNDRDPALPTYAHLLRLATGHRLPRYRNVASSLEERVARGHITHLWREIFDEEPPPGSVQNAQGAFVSRVCEELFPVDVDALYDCYYRCGEDPLQYSIVVDSWGVPWEVAGIERLHFSDRPMVGVVVITRSWRSAFARYYLDESIVQGVIEWWAEQGHDPADGSLDRLAWACSPERAVRLLRRLEPPLDGLATLYKATSKGTGNPFLDLPPGMVQGEYLDWDELHYWNPDDVRALAHAYAQVRDDLERLDRYCDHITARDEERVIETLLTLEDYP